jgi:hypothetical protein
MPKLVVVHAVADTERWLQGKAERAEAIGAAGTNVTDCVAADGSNNVAVTATSRGRGGYPGLWQWLGGEGRCRGPHLERAAW